MVGKFLGKDAIVDLKKSEERTNAIRKRTGKIRHPTRAVVCGCETPSCGGWHVIDENRVIPTEEECSETLKKHNAQKNKKP
jgi:hypothetical protein